MSIHANALAIHTAAAERRIGNHKSARATMGILLRDQRPQVPSLPLTGMNLGKNVPPESYSCAYRARNVRLESSRLNGRSVTTSLELGHGQSAGHRLGDKLTEIKHSIIQQGFLHERCEALDLLLAQAHRPQQQRIDARREHRCDRADE